ncbi:Na/Pi cotransporter family protein [Hwanghaeella grinnelliae]|uniref:Na/Pi cotransporter family protein n=1 Tax=Hwanghaeella grinnelliae TaxID=2500179 RepID=A0A437QUQ2_9PROT|nr:Na/Pi symporter [Hwanghaeella grinnelliae]RVU38250.1 Na/Pi cotransporter family protein [Hwanghaeella grinnelliae]
MEVVLSAAGGLALFLLAMGMMTDGLKVFGGESLKRLLHGWTSSIIRGVLSGALLTAIVQSSSAVTLATIGFVNAGALTMRHALGVIYGANVGTTMTGWIVSLVGIGFKIEPLALPILAVGVATRLLSPGKRGKGLGDALAGFALFFLGLGILKDALSGMTTDFGTGMFTTPEGFTGLAIAMVVGTAITVLTQSSSAAIAVIITAASQSMVGLDIAAAAVIGANIGTTATALIAVIGAAPSAKRVAVGHVVFNLVTALVAIAILPLLLIGLEAAGDWAGLGNQPAVLLALFHSFFNILGVLLMIPLTGRLADLLDKRFRSSEEDMSRPQHLDDYVLSTPVFAVAALHRELTRLLELTSTLCRHALGNNPQERKVEAESTAILALCEKIAAFATSIQMEVLPRSVAEGLPHALRVARYLEEAASLAPHVANLRMRLWRIHGVEARSAVEHAMYNALRFLETTKERRNIDTPLPGEGLEQQQQLDFLAAYEDAKATLLETAAARKADIMSIDPILDALSHTRRIIDQIGKAEKMLQTGTVEGLALEEGANREAEPEDGIPSAVPAPISSVVGAPPSPGDGRLKKDDPM